MRLKKYIISHYIHGLVSFIFLFAFFYLYLSINGYQVGWNLLTNNWIINHNEQYLYSLQYPGRWRLYDSGDEGWHGGARPYQRTMLLEPKPYIGGGIYFTIDQIPLDQPSLEDVATLSASDKRNQENTPSPLSSIIIDERNALVRTYSSDSTITIEAYIARKCDGLILHMNAKSYNGKEIENTFRQMIDEFAYENCE